MKFGDESIPPPLRGSDREEDEERVEAGLLDDDTVFGCQGAAAWPATEGTSPASVLLFRLGEDGSPGEIKALQANAPVTAWEIQGVRGGRSYRLGDATIDLTDRERLTFTVGGHSGWVTIDGYGWDE